jgi:hypothetical protein
MSKKFAIAFGLVMLLPVAAQASIADVFQQLDHGTVDDKNFVMTLMVGIADGFSAVNDELNDNGKPMLYCAPESAKLTGDQLIDISRRWVEANRTKAPDIDTAPPPPAAALLYALEEAFPCSNQDRSGAPDV